MGNEQKPNQIVIQNGEKLRKWMTFLTPIILLIIGNAITFGNIGSSIKAVDTKIDSEIASINATLTQHRSTTCEQIRVVTEKVAIIKKEGTPHSRANRERIIGNERDLQHIKKTVDRIEKIVEKLASMPQ